MRATFSETRTKRCSNAHTKADTVPFAASTDALSPSRASPLSNTDISNKNEISISEDTGKISFLAYIGGKGPEEDEKKKIIEFITSMEAEYNIKIDINYLAAYLE